MNDLTKLEIDKHLMKIDLNKIEYRCGMSYQEAMDMANRNINDLYQIIETLSNRVLELEIQERGRIDE